MYNRHGGDSHRHSLGFDGVQPNHIHKKPPYWDPSFDHKYSFRRYMTDMQHWVLLTDLPPHQQATMVLMNLGGAAYQLINAMPPTELYAGAVVNGVPLDPVSNILLKLHHRFAQQDIVTRMSAMSEMLSFRRHEREGTNSTHTF